MGRQFSATNAGPGSNGGQSQPPSIKGTATSLASMSLRNSVLGTGATVTNGATVTSATTVQQTVTSYSPTPIQRPPGGKGKATLEPAEDSPTVTLDVAAGVKKRSCLMLKTKGARMTTSSHFLSLLLLYLSFYWKM